MYNFNNLFQIVCSGQQAFGGPRKQDEDILKTFSHGSKRLPAPVLLPQHQASAASSVPLKRGVESGLTGYRASTNYKETFAPWEFQETSLAFHCFDSFLATVSNEAAESMNASVKN